MPTQEITTQVSSAHAKQLVADVMAKFKDLREAERKKEEAKEDALLVRYKWGWKVDEALEKAEKGDSVAKEIARRVGRSDTWVRNHARFANAIWDEYHPQWNTDKGHVIDGYFRECEEEGRNKSWTRAVSWIDSRGDMPEDEQQATELEKHQREIERKIRELEEKVQKAQETMAREDVDPEQGDLAGPLQRGAESARDSERAMEQLPQLSPDREEHEEYTAWVAKTHACCACGLDDDTTIPHHLREFAPDTGVGTKPDDYDVVPLCYDCHQTLEDNPSIEFWEDKPVDPIAVAREMVREAAPLMRDDEI
jgi:hypothetical protein